MGRFPRIDHEPHERVLCADEVFAIHGAIFEVNKHMGSGEAVHQECLAIEFHSRGIPSVAAKPLSLTYKGQPLKTVYAPDFICFDRIVLELKAVREITPEHRGQILNYLSATGCKLGLLVNFGQSPKAKVERFIR